LSASPGADRRKHRRLGVRLPLYVSLQGEIYQKLVSVEARNVSEGGLLFETSTPLPVAADSRMMVSRLGGLPDSAHIEAQIVHCRQDPATGVYTIGLRFLGFVDVTAAELIARIEANRPD
jgi:c-di-GMP-binding flagellar brake protein YcgR